MRIYDSILTLVLGWAYVAAAQQSIVHDEAQHGTCAIALATEDNIALMVDSKLTSNGALQPCVQKNPLGCKAVLVRKDVVLAVTGVYNDPINGVDWKVSNETRKLLKDLPENLKATDLDSFGAKWSALLIRHYRSKSTLGLEPGRQISALMLATRIQNVSYLYRATIALRADGTFEAYGEELWLSKWPTLFYAGSCRDHVNTHPEGIYNTAIDPPNPAEKFELQEIGDRRKGAHSVEEFVGLLKEYEQVFVSIEDREEKCWIGPPYDVATWAKGELGWKTNFKAICRPD